MSKRNGAPLVASLLVVGVLPTAVALCAGQGPARTNDWKTCRDAHYGYSLRYPPDWQLIGPAGRCVQLTKGERALPNGVPDVDVSIRVTPLQGNFPGDFLQDKDFPVQGAAGAVRSLRYTRRQDLHVNGLAAVRAEFTTSGPTPNWGIEYVIWKDGAVLDVYISQPRPEIVTQFDAMIRSLHW